MATTEWVLSDDWKLWRRANYSYMNPFKVLRSAAFNTMPVEKLFTQFESSSCCLCYLHLWCGDCTWRSSEQANWKMVYLCCCFFSSGENMSFLFTQSSRLVHRCLLLCWGSLIFLLKGKSKLNLKLLLHYSPQAKTFKQVHLKRTPNQGCLSCYFFAFDSWWKHLLWHNLLGSSQNCLKVSALGECSSRFMWLCAELSFKLLESDYFCTKSQLKRKPTPKRRSKGPFLSLVALKDSYVWTEQGTCLFLQRVKTVNRV